MFQFHDVIYKNILSIPRLTIEDPSFTTIVGESGSGKTTLLHLLGKLISPDRGEILYKGQCLEDLPPVTYRRKVVLLPQSAVIFRGSIRDNLLAGIRFSELDHPSDAVLQDTMESCGLLMSLCDDPIHLSGGEKQRLALARVLLMHPDVYLLDEPSASLDEDTERMIIERIRQRAKEKHKSVVMVTHSVRYAREGSIIRLVKGQPYHEEVSLE